MNVYHLLQFKLIALIGYSFFLSLAWATTISKVLAHGWTEYPIARQTLCYDQGGMWNGEPSDPACSHAKDISGTYPFVQRNEFAKLIPDYNNRSAVISAVPDGTLCYANDPQKSGIASSSIPWQKTEMPSGQFQLVFNATAPHNPSFWEIYLTKPDADLTRPLEWSDLDLIQSYGNIPVTENGKYLMNVTIPSGRPGDAVLFVRWQRVDSAGEGFYNCSDITITNNNTTPPVDPPEEPPSSGPYLTQGALFIPLDIQLESVQVGQIVEYTVFNSEGQAHGHFELAITDSNVNDWDRLLAADITGYYQANHNGDVVIGRWHEDMSHYMYFQNELHGNYFQSRDSGDYGLLSISDAADPAEPAPDFDVTITPKIPVLLDTTEITHGNSLYLFTNSQDVNPESVSWVQTAGPNVITSTGENQLLIVDTSSIAEALPVELSFKLSMTLSGETKEAIYSFTVVDSQTNPPDNSTWDSTQIYHQGDTVQHAGKTWTAQWWTQGNEPGTTGQWGVWR